MVCLGLEAQRLSEAVLEKRLIGEEQHRQTQREREKERAREGG